MFNVLRIDTWMAVVDDRVGGIRDVLKELAKAGVSLEFIIARRTPDQPSKGAVFISPTKGEMPAGLAEKAGFRRCQSVHALRLSGPDEPGIAFLITRALAEEGITLHGLSGAAVGHEFVMYLSFDSEADAARAEARLKRAI